MNLKSLHRKQKGFINILLVSVIAIVPLLVYTTLQIISTSQSASFFFKRNMTKQGMYVVKNLLTSTAVDTDNDGNPELLKEGAGNTIPLSIVAQGVDEWGHALKYYTWDLGSANANPLYSQNTTAPPNSTMIGRIISAGPDGAFQTNDTNTTCQGDDICIDIYKSDVQGAQSSSAIPGEIRAFSGAVAPAGWLACNGATVLRATYPSLAAACIGGACGSGDGVTTFTLPDGRGRALIGAGQGPGLANRVIGQTIGEESHLLSIAEMPSHSHGVNDPGHGHGVNDPGHTHILGDGGWGILGANNIGANQTVLGRLSEGAGYSFYTTYNGYSYTGISIQGAYTNISIQNNGGGSAHNVMQPSLVVNWIIKY